MAERADAPFGDAFVRLFEEASQAILRNMELGKPGGSAPKVDLTRLGESAARVVGGARSARQAGALGRGPVQAAVGAMELAFGVVEAAAGASRRVAGRVLGKESGIADPSPVPGPTASAPFAARPGPSTAGVRSLAPGGTRAADRPAHARAAVSSPILHHTNWAGRAASAGSVSVSPGGIARVPIRIDNRTDRTIKGIRLRSTDLVARGGHLIDDRAVRIDPRMVHLSPGSAQTVTVEIHVPADASPGRYTGVVTALGLPQSGSTIELYVR